MMYKLLPKKRGSRFTNVKTILVSGGEHTSEEEIKSCNEKEIYDYKSIKGAEETGIDTENFTHIILSVLHKYNKKVIVKIHDENSFFIKKELYAFDKLTDFENSVQKICDFVCLDDKSRWVHTITEPITFCNNKKDELAFIVLEYIENGSIEEFFNKNPSEKELCSFFLQIELSIMEMAYNYRLQHGDLNSGNILVATTEKIIKKYRVGDREYRIKTFGIIPKFIDFGRSKQYIGKIYISNILDDIFICLSILGLYIKDNDLKRAFVGFINMESNRVFEVNKKDQEFEILIQGTRDLFYK